MATFRVKYTMTIEQDIEWSDDELDNLNYDNMLCNCDVDEAHEKQYSDIIEITKNGEDYNFE
jgi:hypothetical protein